MLADTADTVLSIARLNVPLMKAPFTPSAGATAAEFLTLPLITGSEELGQAVLDACPTQHWIMHRIGPKLLCRPDRVAQYGLGWHSVADAGGRQLHATPARGIVLIHLPLTTKDRFVRKVENAREFLKRRSDHFKGDNAWHWKRWIGLADRGLLDVEFEAQRMDESTLDRLEALGMLQRAHAWLDPSMQSPGHH